MSDRIQTIVEACHDDFGKLAYDGFGVMLTVEQLEAHEAIGHAGPRGKGEAKTNFVSGGTRSGKTVFMALNHADAALYKRGVDGTDRKFWRNYDYRTLAIAPTDQLTARLWAVMDTLRKGSNDAQYDRKARRSRGGAFIDRFSMGTTKYGGVATFSNGAAIDFRSSEGWATRLEGGSWWFATWDEWASQPDREIEFVWKEVILARLRDHDGKFMPGAWPKPETEHHLVAVMRAIEAGRDTDSKVVFVSSRRAHFTNQAALAVELREKDEASILRTIDGRPAGGAAKEFKPHMLKNLWREGARYEERQEGYGYLTSVDIGLASDSTRGWTWRIPILDGKRVVHPLAKARIVSEIVLKGGPTLTPDRIMYTILKEQAAYNSIVAIDATSMGGQWAARSLRLAPDKMLQFSSRANHRIYGNMRLAAITNGLECLEWQRPPDPAMEPLVPWGLFEAPFIVELNDQMLAFDRDEDHEDDGVWGFLIGAWYIRRLWAIGKPGVHVPREFDVTKAAGGPPAPPSVRRRRSATLLRGPDGPLGPAAVPGGVRMIRVQRG